MSFFYYAPTSVIVYIPLASTDVPFVFNEVTADFQVSSLFNMVEGFSEFAGGAPIPRIQMPWEDRRLVWAVREPFRSRHSAADLLSLT